jgi:pilus assembly protein Flp/PilA
VWRHVEKFHTVADGVSHVSKIKKFLKDESGATAIEYGLIAAGIAVAIIAIVNTLGGTLNGIFTNINTQLRGG